MWNNFSIKAKIMDAAEYLHSLKERGDKVGLSLRQIAREIDVSSAVLYKWMERPPLSLVTLFKFQAAIEAAEAAQAKQWRAEVCDGVPGLRLYRDGVSTSMYVTPEPSSERPEFCNAQEWAKLQAIWDEPF